MPPDGVERDYVIEKRPDGIYAGRVLIGTSVAPGTNASASVRLYAGPQEKRRLEAAAPGLDLVVDYGWLTIIAWPLFWLLEWLYVQLGNFGLSILVLTVIVTW